MISVVFGGRRFDLAPDETPHGKFGLFGNSFEIGVCLNGLFACIYFQSFVSFFL